MASKQLGKLRQWAGEVISTRDKATVSDEFRELEKDIALRKEGVERIYASSEAYKASLARKKDSEALDDSEKLLPIDALGIVMIVHGEEFGPDSAFGTSLVKLGRAHCKIATLQEAYALTLEATFLASTKRFGDDIKDYELQRKKLESRRLSYDAAITKLEKVKSSKKEKEKDRREAEDELQKARLRYEETSEDVRARIHAIQENEIHQLRELTNFLDVELNFMEQYVEVLKDVKSDWCDESQMAKFEAPKMDGPSHIFARAEPKFSSVRTRRSTSRGPNNRLNAAPSSDVSDAEGTSHSSINRRPPPTTRVPDSTPTLPSRHQSRSNSRASRNRSDSAATTGEGTDKENKEKEKSEKGRSLSGWASNAVGSVTGRSKKSKDKDKFAALKDNGDQDSDGEGGERPSSSLSFSSKKLSKSKSKENLGGSPKVPNRILKPPSLQDKKLVRALHDFTGSSDELSFRAGDEIVVVNEVLDGWWMGELDGRKGLFPTPYTEVISSKGRRIGVRNTDSDMASSLSSGDDAGKDGYGEYEPETDHIYSAHHLVTAHSMRSPFSIQSDSASIASSVAEADEKEALMPTKSDLDHDYFPSRTRMLHSLNSPVPLTSSRSATELGFNLPTVGKKVPPPPPPRRSTNILANSPPIPERKQKESRSHSSGSLTKSSLDLPAGRSQEYDTSPFESETEIPGMECRDFKQNPFKPRGMCSNCYQVHE